jgi:tetratricopeptide (TPR) repeat protein
MPRAWGTVNAPAGSIRDMFDGVNATSDNGSRFAFIMGTTRMRRRGRWWARLAAIGLAGLALGLAAVWHNLFADRLAPARAAYDRRDWRTSWILTRDVLRARPEDREARLLMARTLARMGRLEDAQQIFERFRPQDLTAEDYFVMGSGLVDRGDIAVARNALEAALKLNPDHPEALLVAGRLDAGTDRLARAADLAERLAAKPGWEVRGLAMLGLVADDMADPQRAVDALQAAFERDPSLQGVTGSPVPVRLVLARNLLRLGRPEEAETQLQTALEAGPNPEASWLLSRVALQRGDREAFLNARAAAGDGSFAASRPQAFEPAPFVGAARCAECHADIHRSQQHGRHSKTFGRADALDALPLPEGPITDRDNPHVTHRLARDGDRIALTTRVGNETVRAWLAYAVGSGDRGLTPVALDDQKQLRELRLSYYGDIHDWDRTTGHPSAVELNGAHDYLGRSMDRDLLRRCFGCHATDYRAARDGQGPVAQDRGIGCERCHGPGGHHLQAVALKLDDLAIGRPGQVAPAESLKLCAECHSPKGRPVVSVVQEIRFQSLTLPRSKCFTASKGALGCVSCHNPHRDADTDPGYYEAKCLACHNPNAGEDRAGTESASRSARVALPEGANRVSCPVSAASGCLDCHMPTQRDIVPHTVFTDHHIRVHPPEMRAGTD